MNRPDTYESEFVSIDSLKPWPRNYKTHGDDQVAVLGNSLRTFGQFKNVIIWGDYIIAGHGLIDAARSNGYDEIEVKRLPQDFTEEMVEAVLVADNESSRLAEDDTEQLAELLLSVRQADADLLLSTGWDSDELDELLRDMGGDLGMEGADTEPEISRADELRAEWGVQLDQCWQLGPHKIICGDCTDPAVVERLMDGELAALYITDPPYGVSYADKNEYLNSISPANRIQIPIENDHLSLEDCAKDIWLPAAKNALDACSDTASYYWFACQGGDQMMMMMMIGDAGWKVRHELIWVKNNHVLGRSDYNYKHEPILYGWKKDGTHKFYGGFQTSVLEFDKPMSSGLHPTMKPVELIEYLMGNSTQVNDFIYDSFCGSGTTIIACHNLNRICRAAEISPQYTAVCLERFFTHTGIQPELIG